MKLDDTAERQEVLRHCEAADGGGPSKNVDFHWHVLALFPSLSGMIVQALEADDTAAAVFHEDHILVDFLTE